MSWFDVVQESKWRLCVLVVGLNLMSFVNLLYDFKKRRDNLLNEVVEERKQINESCFISGDANKGCEAHLHRKNPCSKSCSFWNLRKLVDGLSSSTKTLDICIHLLSCNEIAECILDAVFQKHVKVRIITDHVMSKNLGSQMSMLHKAGIEIRIPNESMMHSKFAVIDNRALLIGSVNWTIQGLHGNWDAFVITSQPQLVGDFIRNFNIMWNHPDIVKYM